MRPRLLHLPQLLTLLLIALLSAPRSSVALESRPGKLRDLIRVRCSLDGEESWTVWRGELSYFIPRRKTRTLFQLVGASVSRCAKDKRGQWYQSSRELMYYLDPESGERVDTWRNPLTTEEVPVVHLANELVQERLRQAPDMTVSGPFATMQISSPHFYPNRLFRDQTLRSYSPEKMYIADQYRSITTSAEALAGRAPSLPMSFSDQQIGPWLPWMNMGKRPGQLIYKVVGHKVSSYEDVPALIRGEIDTRLQRYRFAPTCYQRRKNVTAWSYFAENIDAYKNRETFPVAAPAVEGECAANKP